MPGALTRKVGMGMCSPQDHLFTPPDVHAVKALVHQDPHLKGNFNILPPMSNNFQRQKHKFCSDLINLKNINSQAPCF